MFARQKKQLSNGAHDRDPKPPRPEDTYVSRCLHVFYDRPPEASGERRRCIARIPWPPVTTAEIGPIDYYCPPHQPYYAEGLRASRDEVTQEITRLRPGLGSPWEAIVSGAATLAAREPGEEG